MNRTVSLLGVLCLCLLPSLTRADTLGDAKRILFLGDSITYGGTYVHVIETTLRLKHPDRQFELINVGLPSETVSGLSEEGHADGKFPRPDLHERLDRVLAKVKPDLVFACYGMNDGIYMPLSDDRFKAFQDGMRKLHQKVEAAGARVVHITPPVFDPKPIADKVVPKDQAAAGRMYDGYDDVLAAYGQWLLEQRKAGWTVIDLHGPMKAELAARRAKDPAFHFSGAGIHPNAQGRLVMARAILAGMRPPIAIDTNAWGDPADPASRFGRVQKIVRERGRILIDAWLTDTGHKRPMKAGMSMAEATARAAALDVRIRAELVRP